MCMQHIKGIDLMEMISPSGDANESLMEDGQQNHSYSQIFLEKSSEILDLLTEAQSLLQGIIQDSENDIVIETPELRSLAMTLKTLEEYLKFH